MTKQSWPDEEIIVDLFAGGGGASEGIRLATGRDPDIAINHDAIAIAMHRANHPGTRHFIEDVWKVQPLEATKGRPVGLLWASPDCKHFSIAKGGAPVRSKEIRALAWVVIKWAKTIRPRIIVLENVSEFRTWGPLDSNGHIKKDQKGQIFNAFIWQLRKIGYHVESKDLSACDFGAPTSRKRFFLIARCDGLPIEWPSATHGTSTGLLPYRTAAEIIDWSIPCPSVFNRKNPLAENTLRRIAEGIRRYVVETAEPFIVTCNHSGNSFRGQCLDDPFRTVTASRDAHGLVVPSFQKFYGTSVGHSAVDPIATITGKSKTALLTANIIRHFGCSTGQPLSAPAPTVMANGQGKTGIVTSHLLKLRGTSKDGQPVTKPVPTLTAGGTHIGEVRAFLMKYYGNGHAISVDSHLHTITTKDRFGVVLVQFAGEPYFLADIGMRMLSPRELFRAQGFDDNYQIDLEINGRRITKADQVRMCGNSVCPPIAKALVEANYEIYAEKYRQRNF